MLQIVLWLLLHHLEEEPVTPVNTSTNSHYTYYHRGAAKDIDTETSGGLALMGGSTDVDRVFQWMAQRGGNGDFLILRGSGADGYQDYVDEIADVNSVSTLVLKSADAAHDPFVLDKVKNAEAIFYAGGDQWNYVGKWKNSPLLAELNRALIKGVPMGGTSAGLAILGEHVFSAEKDTITSPEAMTTPYHEAITLESNFLQAKPLKNVITDSHFSERDRMGRLVTFMARLQNDNDLDTVHGIGVDEKTAVLVSPDGTSQTVGKGSAHFVEAHDKPTTITEGRPLTHRALVVHSVSDGQTFDLNKWTSNDVEARSMTVENGNLSYQ